MDNLIGVALDGVVVLLLTAAIVYGVVLHRKLTALQSAQSELATLLGRLDGAITQATSTVSAFESNAAMIETSRATLAAERGAPDAKPPAPKATAAAPRKPAASLSANGRFEAAKELLSVMNAMRSAG